MHVASVQDLLRQLSDRLSDVDSLVDEGNSLAKVASRVGIGASQLQSRYLSVLAHTKVCLATLVPRKQFWPNYL